MDRRVATACRTLVESRRLSGRRLGIPLARARVRARGRELSVRDGAAPDQAPSRLLHPQGWYPSSASGSIVLGRTTGREGATARWARAARAIC